MHPRIRSSLPLYFSRSDDGQKFYLCIDEEHPGFNQDGDGNAILKDDGTPSEYTDNVLRFLSQYQAQFLATQELCKKLKHLNLLERKQVEATLPDGETLTLSGFFTVERSRLTSLPSEAIVDLVRSGFYELICHHLASLGKFDLLRDRSDESRAVGEG